jgi:hypothetical protein
MTLRRSQIADWDTAHRQRAAAYWKRTAEMWEHHFTSVQQCAVTPGGAEWLSETAEAVQTRTLSDLIKVRGLADILHTAASAARSGATSIDFAKRNALSAIMRAEAARFDVGEHLELTSRDIFAPGPVRTAKVSEAHGLADEILTRAAALSAADREVAANVASAAAELADVSFPESPTEARTVGNHELLFETVANGIRPFPVGYVHCIDAGDVFACQEVLPGGGFYHWVSPADLTGHWPD